MTVDQLQSIGIICIAVSQILSAISVLRLLRRKQGQ